MKNSAFICANANKLFPIFDIEAGLINSTQDSHGCAICMGFCS